MREVSDETAVRLLKADTYKYLAELMALELHIPPAPVTIFANKETPTALMLYQDFSGIIVM